MGIVKTWPIKVNPDKTHIAKRKIKPGRGFLQQTTKKLMKTSPDFKGAMILDRDYKKGRRLWISAWLYKDQKGFDGTVIFFTIANLAQRNKQREELRRKEWKKLQEARRKFDERRAKALAAPKILKREDVL